ncbi:3-phosphoshikimate 1-carboxyvinyltransferase [Candidatus Liberibacter brunswickensis]|uniref:3-phosphoshikimate 1-carboxyvinyltransferase n=1 Tax=Candidatus Liberibacter brunswickensis TaxID=1968796 RepID=UPI002FDF884D
MSSFYKKNTIKSSYSCSLKGTVSIPGDRYFSHCSVILGGIASGKTQISGLLESDDVLNTMKMMNYLGANYTKKNSKWIVEGVGNGCLLSPEHPMNFKDFYIGYELIMGVVGVYDFQTFFKGCENISQKSIKSILDPLRNMGVQVIPIKRNCLPLSLHGPRIPNPISYRSPVASSQLKSVVLLAGLNTPGITEIVEPVKTHDHIENILKEFGVDLLVTTDINENYSVRIEGRKSISGCNLKVPGDPSFALFVLSAALLIAESNIKILRVSINPLRVGLINILQEMGANISFSNIRIESGENIADIQVRSSKLRGISISKSRIRSIIDECPILMVISAFAEGKTIMNGLEDLMRSNQFFAILECLQVNNIKYEKGKDHFVIIGAPSGSGLGSSSGHMVQSKFGYNIAMSFLIMGFASEYSVLVDDCYEISAVFPDFINLMQGLGARIEWIV